ncbi:12322_t:CDS:2, partial [Dentiscutata erythropus]
QVKRLVDTIKYTGPIIVMSDNTKLKERLGFSSLYSCIVGSTLSTESTKVSSYEDIYQIIDTIKLHNAIASQVRAINHAYEQVTALAKDVLGMMLTTKICSFITIMKESKTEIRNETKNQLIDLQEFNDSQKSSSSQSDNFFISVAATEVNI